MEQHVSSPAPDLPWEVWFQLEFCEGWLMLGNPAEAVAEFDKVAEANRGHPNVLALQWRISEAVGNREDAWHAAFKLCELLPDCAAGWICQANSLRQIRGVQAAADLLLSVAQRFGAEPVVAYNLACYLAQLGEWEKSWSWLRDAFAADRESQLKVLALLDPDLKPLWDQIGDGVAVVQVEIRESSE